MDNSVTCTMSRPTKRRQSTDRRGEGISSNQSRERENRARTDLQAALVEPLDGDGDAVRLGVGRTEEALVDAAESALAELLRAAEVGRGGLQLLVLERAQLAVAPLLVQRRDDVLRLRR
jgi:hypothetical protein